MAFSGGICWNNVAYKAQVSEYHTDHWVKENTQRNDLKLLQRELIKTIDLQIIIHSDDGSENSFDLEKDFEPITESRIDKCYNYQMFGKFGEWIHKIRRKKNFWFYFFVILGVIHLILNLLICILIVLLFKFSCQNFLNNTTTYERHQMKKMVKGSLPSDKDVLHEQLV
jgi:hypothetical protein